MEKSRSDKRRQVNESPSGQLAEAPDRNPESNRRLKEPGQAECMPQNTAFHQPPVKGRAGQKGRNAAERNRGGRIGAIDLADSIREPARPRKRRIRLLWTDELREILTTAYLEGGTRAAKKAVQSVQRNWSDESIVQELNRLGLRTATRSPRVPLAQEETAFLLNSLGGSNFRRIAEVLGRPEGTVWTFLRRVGYHADDQTESYKTKDVADLLGVTVRQVRRWVWKWYLWTEHGRIPVESLAVFMKRNGHLLPPNRIRDVKDWLRELGKEMQPEKLCESQKEVAARLGVTKATVRLWIERGWLEKAGKGVTWGAVARFLQEHPEEISYTSLRPHFREWVKRLGYHIPVGRSRKREQAEHLRARGYSAPGNST
jgi:hypothetical protein